jgi:hypothetical protein
MHPSAAGNRHRFSLCPFDPGTAPPVALSGCFFRRNSLLQVEFRLTGTLRAIAVPLQGGRPQRRNGLWQKTCFELFFAPAEADAYHEVNLSSTGHWNLYRFDGYREGMREEPADCLKCRVLPASETLVFRLEIDLARLGLEDQTLGVGACAVLLSKERTPSYWALVHPGPQPDFHDPRSRPFFL